MAAAACPCGSGAELAACCARYWQERNAPTAEALMRSRYTAHVVNQIDYIVATHDVATRERIDLPAVERWARSSEWMGLQIVACEQGGAEDQQGIVEFKAKYREKKGAIVVHHERSRFVKTDGHWYYVDGMQPRPEPARRSEDQGRNELCRCGSGKKFKRCCLGKSVS